MKLTEKQKKLIKAHLKKWKNETCIFCGNNKWTMSDTILELREFDEKRSFLGKGEQVMPVISLICNGCYHVVLLNALRLNIVEDRGKNNGDEKKD